MVIVERQSQLVRLKLMAASRLAMTIGLLPLFLVLVLTNSYVCATSTRAFLSDDNHITTSRRNSHVPFGCTVVVPYEWVWIVGSCLSTSNLRPFHGELVEGVQIPFFLRSSFVLFSPSIQ
jgi:hypothetical protein